MIAVVGSSSFELALHPSDEKVVVAAYCLRECGNPAVPLVPPAEHGCEQQ